MSSATYIESLSSRFNLLAADKLINLTLMGYLLKGVIPAQGLVAFYGASGSGKSFLILDLAFAIAAGDSRWFGLRIRKAPVTYICLEGVSGLSKRLEAWGLYHNKSIPDVIRFVTQPFNLLSDDVIELGNAIKLAQGTGGMVIIDTLNRAIPGADENSSVDMGKVIAASSKLQNVIDGVVVLAHHTGKDESKKLRGHSSLLAALDGAIEVVNNKNIREWSVAKSKDDVTGRVFPFSLEIVNLGQDMDGDEITSCVVLAEKNIDGGIRKLLTPKSSNQKVVLNALQVQFKLPENQREGHDKPCVRLDDAIEKIKGLLVCDHKRQRERTQSAIQGLISNGYIRHQDGWLWAV